MKIGAIILAAGSSSRMGKAKMLLPFGNGNMLKHIIAEVEAINLWTFCLVTGFYHEQVKSLFQDHNLPIVYNINWELGMSASIQLGLQTLLHQHPDLEGVLIIVSDQPFLNREVLQKIVIELQQSQKGIVAAQYGGVNGTPVLFHKKYFEDLQKLTGDKGAGLILQQHFEDLAVVPFPNGEFDIDTPEDYELLCKKMKEPNVGRYIQ